MLLYICLTIWFFILLLAGLRPGSIIVADSWPALPEDNVEKRNQSIVLILCGLSFLVLWFLTAFRSREIGNDVKNYLVYFQWFSNGPIDHPKVEIGYQLLNFLIWKISSDGHIFLLTMATIMYCGLGLYFYKFSNNLAFTLCLFFSCFFSIYTSILRQGMAMIVALYGYQLLKNKRRILAALVFLLATSFHTTAFLCFLLFLNFDILKKWWFVLGITAACVIASLSGVMKSAVNLVFPKYTHYFAGQYAGSGWLAISVFLFTYIVFYLLVSKSLDEDNKSDNVIATNFTLLLLLTAFGYAVNLFERAGEYFLLIGITELPNVLYRGKVKHFRFWLLMIGTFYLILFILILIYRPGWNHLYPYEFWH